MTRFHTLIAALVLAITSLTLAAVTASANLAPSRDEIRRMIVQEAMRSHTVPPSLALAVAKAESNFDASAVSSAGARGVMQIMPRTGRDVFDVDPDALWEPRLNIQLGIEFLEDLIEQYDGRWDLALSHYNGGSAVGRPPHARVIPATQKYVNKVLRLYRRYERDATVARLIREAGIANASLRASLSEQEPGRFSVKALRPWLDTDERDEDDRPWKRSKKRRAKIGDGPAHVGPDWRPDQDWLVEPSPKPGKKKWRAYAKKTKRALKRASHARAAYRTGRMTASKLMNQIEDRKDRFRTLLQDDS